MNTKASVAKSLPQGKDVQMRLTHIYNLMYLALGDRKWWPADNCEEIIFGAILVQSVAWSNTVKALGNLRQADLLSFAKIYEADIAEVEACVVPTRYYRMKAKKLKAFATHLMERYDGNLPALLERPMIALREELLGVYGIGPETADDIILYAAEQPTFVIDAFTKRVFHRIGICSSDIPYEDLRLWFMHYLPHDVPLFNQYHALLDGIGHHYCANTKPKCSACPLRTVCDYALSDVDENSV
jgi:endonuclease III related protein